MSVAWHEKTVTDFCFNNAILIILIDALPIQQN